ncbi:MAG: glycosyltransferase family 39 protein [Acidobacteriota bacterium]
MIFSKKGKYIIAGFLIILLSFLLRVYSPTSELPPDISISGSIYTDEGNQCHNSRNRILFGEWFPDDWKITNYNPVVPYFKFFIFKLFGVGLVQVRMVSFIFSLLSLIFFFLILRSYFSPQLSLAGITLLGFNFLYIMFNRIGTFETPMIFWMIFSVYLIEKFRKRGGNVYLALSGISAFMAFVFKMTGAHFIPVPAAALLLFLIFYNRRAVIEKRELVNGTIAIILGILIVFFLWLFIFYIPNREWIKSAPGSYIGNQMFPKSLNQVVGNILAYNWKEQFYKMWVVWTVSILYLPFFFRRLIGKISNITEIAFILFLFSHTAALMIMNHRPTRYLIAAIPPMVFLSIHFASAFQKFFRSKSETPKFNIAQRSVIFILDVLWLGLSSYYCFLPLLKRFFGFNGLPGFSPVLFAYSAAAIFILYLIRYIFVSIPFNRSVLKHTVSVILVFFLVLSLYTNLKYYIKWDRDKTSYIEDISLEMGEKIKNGYIAGLTAPVAVLENRHKSLFLYPKFVHWEKDTLKKYSITHTLLANFNFEISNFFSRWPDKMSRSRLLNVYNVKDQFLHLYSLVNPGIENIKVTDDKKLFLRIKNPGLSGEIRIGKILIRDGKDPEKNKIMEKIDIPEKKTISSGLNDLFYVYEKGEDLLIFPPLYYIKDDIWKNTFRYEGEKFPRKTGKDLRYPGSSGKYVRYFNPGAHGKGFISCSNSGKFIPYNEGLMKVDFILKFKKSRSRILPLAVIDIFNNSDNQVSTSRKIKKRDITGTEFSRYSLFIAIKEKSDIEFRVFATGLSEIFLDYIEITYFQGKFIK